MTLGATEELVLHTLSSLLTPKSIAVLGASPRADTLGNTVIKNLVSLGFSGAVYPIHPSAAEVLGIPAYTSIHQVAGDIDCAVIALSFDKVLDALHDIEARGISNAVVFASGFAESGPQGAQIQQDLTRFCKAHSINLCGPNCLGTFNANANVALYSAALPQGLRRGKLALLSHSGSACIALSNLNRFGFSQVVSLGNGAVNDIADYLDFVADDPSTAVAALFMEALPDPVKFGEAARKMKRLGKAVVALKVGRSVSGAAASAAHTGAIATPDRALQAYFEQLGVVLVNDYDELVETCDLFLSNHRVPAGTGLAVLNVSGGELALTCDIAEQIGVSLPPLSPTTIEALKAILPAFATPRNPLDATGVAVFDTGMYEACIRALDADPNVALIAISQDCPCALGAEQAATYERLAHSVAASFARISKPLVFFNNVGDEIHGLVKAPLAAAGIAHLRGMRNALSAIASLLRFYSHDARVEYGDTSIRQDRWAARLANGKPLTERESKQFLSDHAVPVTQEFLAVSDAEAASIAARIGFPVVMKVDSEDIAHKTEVGGVVLNVANAEQAVQAFRAILNAVTLKAPHAIVNGVLVQQQIDGGVESLVGMVRHKPFGPGMVVGCGGIYVELMQDSAFAFAPVSKPDAHRMIGQTRLSRLLSGYRGMPAADEGALAEVISRMSHIASAYDGLIDAIDLNPVSVLPSGQGVVVLDALIVPNPTPVQNA